MKNSSKRKWLVAAMVTGTAAFARADVAPDEELVAFGESAFWLGPDEIVAAFGQSAFWLGPDEIAVASDEREFALVVFRDLPASPTADDIRASIKASGAVDANRILALIFGAANPVAAYHAFMAWARGIGELDVMNSAHAGDSFALGAASLFENEPSVEFMSFAPNASAQGLVDVAVTVKDGDTEKPVSSEKVAGMFEATTDIGDWTTSAKQLEPHVTDRTQGLASPVEFTVKPGDGKADKAFLRIRK